MTSDELVSQDLPAAFLGSASVRISHDVGTL